MDSPLHHPTNRDPPNQQPGSSGKGGIGGGHGGGEKFGNVLAFWVLGLVNNLVYVVMNAGAKEIAEGGIALVYLANIVPSLVVKVTGPYWFPVVPYHYRITLAAISMTISLITVALTQTLGLKLMGVCFCSFQSGLGEASILALTSYYHGPSTITAWSSGTGFAGIMGYAWVWLFTVALGQSFTLTLLLALLLPVIWCITYFLLLHPPPTITNTPSALLPVPLTDDGEVNSHEKEEGQTSGHGRSINTSPSSAHQVSFHDRVRLLGSLWQYTTPLILVYTFEYTLQTGVWSAMGFPEVTSANSRKSFYTYSNWAYQVGVFISRSSGLWLPHTLWFLWSTPALQLLMLAFFTLDAIYRFWNHYTIIAFCLFTGLLGGANYVVGFSLISHHHHDRGDLRELALATSSIADTLGIMVADLMGVLVQGCLYHYHAIPGGTYKCGAP